MTTAPNTQPDNQQPDHQQLHSPQSDDDRRRGLSVWETGHRTPTAQRADHYTPETIAHPARMLPAVAGYAIETFTSPGQLVCDPMCGAGTTLVEAVRRGRPALGVDIEPRWAQVSRENLAHTRAAGFDTWSRVLTADARGLPGVLPRDVAARVRGKVSLVLTSPPYGPGTHGQVTTGGGPVRKTDFHYSPRGQASQRGRNLAYQPLHRLLAGFAQVIAGCVPLLAPGGLIAVTARPWREYGELVDLPDLLTQAAETVGLVLVQRCVALLGRLDGEQVIDRASFFQRSTVAKGRRAGAPWHLITHEDVLIYAKASNPSGSGSGKLKNRQPTPRRGAQTRATGQRDADTVGRRGEHRHLIGVTGRAESEWLANERQRQFRAGNPVVIFDPTSSMDIVNSLGITLPPEAGPAGTPPVPR